MIQSLELALEMRKRCRTREVVVSADVFLRVLDEHRQHGDEGVLALNRHYSSPRFRFIHRAYWGGIRFIHFSNAELQA